jgi:hypothetical protein
MSTISLGHRTQEPALHQLQTLCLCPCRTASQQTMLHGFIPYNNAFKEEMDLRTLNISRHRAAGMIFLPQDDQLILASMTPSTPGARVPRWRTRLCGAWLLSVNGTPVHTLAEAHQVFHNLYYRNAAS